MNLQIDRDDSLSLRASGGVHQPLLTSLLPKLVKEGDFVVDVGAHIGYFTVQLGALVGPNGRVVAFEPARHTYKILKENCERMPWVLPINAAVSSENSVGKLFLCEENAGDHRLYVEGHRRWVPIDTVKLDSAIADWDKLDLLKIDVQGWEGFILEGCVDLVLPMIKKIVFEFWPTGLRAAGYYPEKLLKLLEAYGFSFWNIDEIRGDLRKTDIIDLTCHYPAKPDASTENIKPGDFTDILAVKKGENIDGLREPI